MQYFGILERYILRRVHTFSFILCSFKRGTRTSCMGQPDGEAVKNGQPSMSLFDGGVIGDISTNESVQKYKFEGPRSHQKEIDNLLARRRAFRRGVELDRTFGLDNYDIHARQYFAMAPMWDRVDPLAEKYFGISPYAYCGGDPVNRKDKNGMYIKFAEGSSLTFITQFTQAYAELSKAGAAGMINQAMYNPSYTITIKELSNNNMDGSYYKDGTINWAPLQGSICGDNDYVLSPMEILNHEFDHAIDDQTNDQHAENTKTKDADYKNKEERRVITGSEQDVAKRLGKRKSVQVTRSDHFGEPIIVDSPTSSTPVDLIMRVLNFEIEIMIENK